MHETIGSYDAKTRLSELLRRVEAGDSFTITNRGKPVAEIVPSDVSDQRKRKSAINNILARKKISVSDDKLQEYRRSGRK